MKNIIFIASLSLLAITSGALSSCQSSAQKAETADIKVEDAKKDLKDAEKAAVAANQQAANAEEWRVLKSETEIKIKNNETTIAELNAKMKASGKTLDAVYAKSIGALEQKNRDLKMRMDAYEKGPSSWSSFKEEFNHDMDELGAALKDLTVNNKK